MKKIWILGSLNMDLVIHSPREVLQGETIHGSNFMTNGGGKGANQASACGKLGGDVYMGGCVGMDSFGEELLSNLNRYGVHTEHVRRVEGVPTGVAVITIINHDNRIILDSGANAQVTEEDIDGLLKDAAPGDLFLTQLENPIERVGYALKRAKECGLVTILNPAPCNKEIEAYFSYVDYIVPNETELASFTGEEDVALGAQKMRRMGVPNVIVTLGKKGYYFDNGEEVLTEGCVEAPRVDTTAAGDTFCGAFATRLARGESPKQALYFANHASAITITRPGAAQSIPTLNEMHAVYGL